ncbi:MAG: hypothetical protein HQL69_18535 [Magnetococcales bacterium]|nr:hypothetical protein [Magnetococcales bacterium]
METIMAFFLYRLVCYPQKPFFLHCDRVVGVSLFVLFFMACSPLEAAEKKDREIQSQASSAKTSVNWDNLEAVHFAPIEAREYISKHGLVDDVTLFRKVLGRRDSETAQWLGRQLRAEKMLNVWDLQPVHVFLFPPGSLNIVQQLAEERGPDMRVVNMGPLIRAGRVIFTYGRGPDFNNQHPEKRLFGAQDLLRVLAILSLERKFDPNKGPDWVIDAYVFPGPPDIRVDIPIKRLITVGPNK